MPGENGRVLVVDDDDTMTDLSAAVLRRKGYAPMTAGGGDEALAALAAHDVDVVVTDLHMPGMSGHELCERVVGARPDVPVVVLTAYGDLDAAVAAIRAGAYDFLTKPVENEVLLIAIARAVRHRRMGQELTRLRTEAPAAAAVGMLGDSAAMQKVFDLVARVADTDVTVLVTGESGTGKELVAHALHDQSRRRNGPFVAINCAAMPEQLLESELFGHRKGSFTDARADRKGLFVQADGGTLFLDEVGELPPALQAKLLRALQEHVVRPVGSDVEVRFDARVVAATNRDLETAIEERRFREDLYYRLNVVHVALPPLRARGADALRLAQAFTQRYAGRMGKRVAGIAAGAAEKIVAYAWPGNVRELQNAVERAVALARFDQITVEDLPEKVQAYRRSHVVVAGDDPSELVPMEEVERRYILRVMEAVGGNKTQAAQVLGLDRKTLYRKLERYGVEGGGAG